MCEKQIMTPCNSILYCSEAYVHALCSLPRANTQLTRHHRCRRKDSSKPLSASSIVCFPKLVSTPSSPRVTQPTRVPGTTPEYYTPSLRIPSDLHDHKSDLDPTEWKPKLPPRGASEAFRYLSRFHQNMNNSDTHNVKIERPRAHAHKSTLSMTTTTTPSLGNTPTTASSSFDSINMYDLHLRPLPPRHHPLYSTSAGAKGGLDLVTPHMPPSMDVATSVPNATDNEFWGKKVVLSSSTPTARGNGLGALFGKDK